MKKKFKQENTAALKTLMESSASLGPRFFSGSVALSRFISGFGTRLLDGSRPNLRDLTQASTLTQRSSLFSGQ